MTCSTERVAVIVVRMWAEGPADGLRARITFADDLGDSDELRASEQHSELATGAEQVLARVQECIQAFTAHIG
jgi:hypothetical protein